MDPVVLVTRVGAAAGAPAAAAALACAASDPDRAALLIDVGDRHPPRATPVATAAARALEERLSAHLPDAFVASRGCICRLWIQSDAEWGDRLAAALPLARESAALVHLSPDLLRPALAEPRIRATGALLRADLGEDRALAALAAGDLMAQGLRLAVLKQAPGWLASRAALLGMLPPGASAIPARVARRLLPETPSGPLSQPC